MILDKIKMPQSDFFLRKSQPKRKKQQQTTTKQKQAAKKARKDVAIPEHMNEDISSGDESSDIDDKQYNKGYSSEEETEQEKKLRLTKKYLDKLEEEEREKNVDETETREAVAQRLKEQTLEEAGRLQKKKAHEYESESPITECVFRGHNLSITCIVISSTEKYLFSASKDCTIIKWSLEEKKKIKSIPKVIDKSAPMLTGHTDHILALALSWDDKFLVSGGKDKKVFVWNAETLELLRVFTGHNDSITGLAFQKGLHQFISASADRSLKLWSLDEMCHVESLFGHQAGVTGIDCFHGEIALTSGGVDNTIRLWKIVEESQLVYQGNGCSIDCLCVSSYQCFVSGGDDGTLFLWGTHKKKPLSTQPVAHGMDLESDVPNWIVSVCALPKTDLLASGSKDGFIRLWKRDDDSRKLIPVSQIPVDGFVNTLNFSPSGKFLIAGIGQEHRLGRWWKIKESKNCIVVYSWKNVTKI